MHGTIFRKSVGIAVAAASALSLAVIGVGVVSADEVQPNIIGGSELTQPWPGGAKVSLQYDAPNHDRAEWHTCGASLVFGRFVVTAAHCVTDPPADASAAELEELARSYNSDLESLAIPTADKNFYVRIGSDDRTQGRLVDVVEQATSPAWAIHEEWNWVDDVTDPNARSADVAILQLAEYVDDVRLLPLAPREPRQGETVYQLGWGITDPNGEGPLPRFIYELKAEAKNKQACEPGKLYGWTPGDICVGVKPASQGNGACSGDSGGPLGYMIDDTMYTAGIVSRTVSDYCGVTPESYTSTVTYRGWIYAEVRNQLTDQERRDFELAA